ncbi:TonB family protein [Zhongshania arctica]|uniref:TonB family protein n=1 Tax=Zhongshania arctica TaxID=3238302 RepID=A0ABV3U008_9GAMM
MNIVEKQPVLGFDYWGIHSDAERRFRKILLNVLGFTCLLFIGLPFWVVDPLSDIEKIQPEEYYLEIIPPAPVPAAVVKPKVAVKPAAPKKPIEVVKEIAPTVSPVADVIPERVDQERNIAAAKKVAAASGVLAFSEQLAMLRDTETQTLVSGKPLRDRGRVMDDLPSTAANVLSTNTRGTNADIVSGENVSDKGSKIDIGSHSTQKIAVANGAMQNLSSSASSAAAGVPQLRSLEEVQLAFDRSKSAFYAIFNRAARKDSTIGAGTVVVSLTIQPDGSVSDASVVSSSFFNPELKSKLLQRVKQIKFESRSVPVFVYDNYPISYVPR